MEYNISKGASADINAIAQFQVDMAKESEDLQLDMPTVIKGVTAVVEDPSKGLYFVARDGNKPIGSLMLTKEWSDWNNSWYWWIQSVYVAPDYRRQGVFTALYHAVYDAAKEEKVCQIRLYVDKTNTRAQSTYQKLGMHESHYLMYETLVADVN